MERQLTDYRPSDRLPVPREREGGITVRVHARLLVIMLGVTALLLSGCSLRPLLSGVSVAPTDISPNADGKDDVTHIRYQIGRPADVSVYLLDAQGGKHYFRNAQRRSPGKYDVYWGGVINDPQVRQAPGG